MSTDERHLLIMVERLPDEIAQVYSRTKHKKSLQHRNSFKHRKLKDKGGECGESDGAVLSPAARETGKPTTVSSSRLPMSLPMYSRSISLPLTHEEKTEAGNQSLKVKVKVEPRVKIKIKSNKRGGSHESNKVLRKIKIRRISHDALPPSTPETDVNTDVRAPITKNCEEGSSKEPSEKYEIVSSSGKVTNFHEESGGASEESGAASASEQTTITKGNVEAWLRDHVGETSEGMKEDANSVSEGSVFKETNTSDESLVDQDTESYNTDQEDLVESDGSQRTEIDATNCTSSDTEIEEPEQCQPEVASFVDVDTAALMSDEGSSHSDMLHECSTALEQIVSEVCAEEHLPIEEDRDSSDNNCAEDVMAEAGLHDSPSPSAETRDISVQPSEAVEEVAIAEVLDDDELNGDEQGQAVLPIDVIDITDDAFVPTSQVGEPQPRARTDMPPDSSTSESNSGKTSCTVDVVDLTSDDVDCYVVSPENCGNVTADPEVTANLEVITASEVTAPEVTAPEVTAPEATASEVTAASGMTGVCMAAAKELDLFANMTILASWDIEAESILECAGEYLGHLEKCLTSLDLMEEAFKSMLVTSLQKKGRVFKQIFVLLKKLLRHSEQLNRVQSIESGFCVLLGIEAPSQTLPSYQISGTEAKEPNSATKALIQRLSAAVDDDHARVPVEKTSIAQEVPSVQHRPPQQANSANGCGSNAVNTRCLKGNFNPAPYQRPRMTWRNLVAVANRRERECAAFRAAAAAMPVVSQAGQRRPVLGMPLMQSNRAALLATSRVNLESRVSLHCDRSSSSSSQSTCSVPKQQLVSRGTTQQLNSRSTTASNLQPIIQRQIYHGQPALRQGSDSKVSTLLKELKQIASGSPSSSSTSSDAREKVVTLDAKQAQPSRQATVESTSVAASPLLSVTSASLSRQISVLPVATAGCSSKVTVLPVNVTVLPATSAATSSTITTNTTDASVAGGAKALPQASSSRASPHSILQKLQRNLGLTVRPVQQKEKLAKDSTATDGSPLQKNVPADVTTSSSETASVSRNNVIAIPSGLSITSAPARVSSADKAATKTAEQVAVIQLGKGNQRQLPLPTAKPTTAPTASTAPGMRVNMAALQQSTSAAAAQAALQRTVNASGSASRTVPPQQQRPVVYSRHVVDARPTQTSSAHPSPIVSRPVTIVASSGTAAPPASKTSTVTTTSQRLLLPRLPAGVVQPASTVPRQTVPKQPPVQAATSVAPVLVQATTLQDVRWSQHQQNQQLCLTVPGFRVVQSPSFQSRAVVVPPPPPLQWCGPTVAVGRPVSTNVWRPPIAVPFPWGGFAPQDPRFVARAHPSGQRVLPGQAMPTQQPILPQPPPYHR
ncbi:mucin-17 isoform X2 [Rhipicephalus sanguineus]|uniref:mucin-17 isoform X2 n=1 Tax=Rhipicephalus sanguineus TaxID=34632 RepID=UPI0018945E80|nr:mucin-17 isoform X2 [Rhipicephalus sanguineus]